ncbi:MAG: alpha/beta hydrolase [Spirochaetia bacterium]
MTENDITFGKGGDVDLTLDLARPEGNGPFPAIVFIHGGSWLQGSKADYDYPLQKAAARGYVAVTVNYRLTYETLANGKARYPFPAQIKDVKCAVRWLRANAGKYRIDPDHIGVLGFSAGGHLALLLGLTQPSDGFEGDGGYAEYSSRVQAVVNSSGPTELGSSSTADAFTRFLGGTYAQVPEAYAKASPVTYVRKDGPPVLTIHGDKDDVVSLTQAQDLDAKMKAVGASHTLVVKKGAGHTSFHEEKAAWDFFDRNLKVSWWHRLVRSFRK